MMATDFSYGWDSPNTHRLYRIEAQSNVTVENDYIFTIDGIRFTDLPQKPVGGTGRKSVTENTNSRYGSEVNNLKRTSVGETSSHSNNSQQRGSVNSRQQFQSPSVGKSRSSDDFDPFDSGSNHKTDSSFDPFSNNTNKSGGGAGGFDPFNNSPPPAQSNARPAAHSGAKSAAKSIFDTVEEESPAVNSTFDAFGSNDPFTNPSNTASNSDFGFDPFNEGNKKPTPVKGGFAPPPAQPAQRKPANHAAPDFFSQPVATNNAPAQPARRASAVEISMDFAGMSFESKPVVQETPQVTQQPRDVPREPEAEQQKEQVVDPWASNLVDLDLSGKTQATRRASLQATSGPSLNQMMGNSNQRRASVNTTNDPFGAPDLLPLNNPIPPAQPLRPLNPAQAISSLGGPANPYGVPPPGVGYGAAPGYGAPAPVPGYGAGRSSITMQPGLQPGYGGVPPPAMQNTRGSFIGGVNPQGYASQPPKNSLDSLDWRS